MGEDLRTLLPLQTPFCYKGSLVVGENPNNHWWVKCSWNLKQSLLQDLSSMGDAWSGTDREVAMSDFCF